MVFCAAWFGLVMLSMMVSMVGSDVFVEVVVFVLLFRLVIAFLMLVVGVATGAEVLDEEVVVFVGALIFPLMMSCCCRLLP